MLRGEPDVVDGIRVDPDDVAAHRIERDLAVAHDDHAERERRWREHAPLSGGDRIDRDERRLDDVLQVRDLLVELVIVIDQPVTVILDADVRLERERHGRPRMRLELGAVDEEVRARDRLGREQVVAQALRMRDRDLDLLLFLEAVALDVDLLQHRVPARFAHRHARRHGDAAALSSRELRHRRAADIAQRAKHALAELRPRVRVGEQRSGGDQVRLDQRAAERPEPELLETLANDRADPLRVVVTATAEDDLRLCRNLHASEHTLHAVVTQLVVGWLRCCR